MQGKNSEALGAYESVPDMSDEEHPIV